MKPPFGENYWIMPFGGAARTSWKPDSLHNVNPTEMWAAFVPGAKPVSSLVVNNGSVYASAGGNLVAFDEQSGAASLHYAHSQTIGVLSMAGEGENAQLLAELGVQLLSFNPQTLTLLWRWTGVTQGAYFPFGVPASSRLGLAYCPGGDFNGELYGVLLTTNRTKFDQDIFPTAFGSDSWGATLLENSTTTRLFASTQAGEGNPSAFTEVDPSSGKVLWSMPLNENWIGYVTGWTTAVSGHYAVAVNLTSSDRVDPVVIDVDTRAVLWTQPCATPQQRSGPFAITPATDGSSVFAACSAGINVWEIASGKRVGFLTFGALEGTCGGPLVVTNTHLLASCNSKVLIFEIVTQRLVGSLNTSILSPTGGYTLAYHGGWVFIGHENGSVQAYALQLA